MYRQPTPPRRSTGTASAALRAAGLAAACALVLATGPAGIPAAHAQNHPPISELALTNGAPLVITNTGDQPVKATIVGWHGADPAPVSVESTGPIAAGAQASYAPGAWTGAPAIDRIAVYSFNTKTLRDAGIDLEPADDLVADRMLEVLFFSVQRDAVEHDAFRSAYVAGTVYRDVDQSKAWGSPLQVQGAWVAGSPSPLKVDRALTLSVPPAVLNAAVAKPEAISGYRQPANPNIAVGPMNPLRTCLTLVDSGKPWHPLFNGLVFKAGCP